MRGDPTANRQQDADERGSNWNTSHLISPVRGYPLNAGGVYGDIVTF
jgi:hypothetical protein